MRTRHSKVLLVTKTVGIRDVSTIALVAMQKVTVVGSTNTTHHTSSSRSVDCRSTSIDLYAANKTFVTRGKVRQNHRLKVDAVVLLVDGELDGRMPSLKSLLDRSAPTQANKRSILALEIPGVLLLLKSVHW